MALAEDLKELVLEFRKISSDIESHYHEKEKFLKTLKVSQPMPSLLHKL